MSITQEEQVTIMPPEPAVSTNATSFRLGLFGDTRSGKTMYLTALDWLAKEGPIPEGVNVRPGDPESARYLGDRVAMIRNGQWPPPSADDSDLNLLIEYKDQCVALYTTDFRGGDFKTAFYKGSSTDCIAFVRRLLGNRHAYVFLVDPGQLEQLPDEKSSSVVLALENIRPKGKKWVQRHRPVAIVFTKCDQHPDVTADPEDFARRHMKQTYTYLKNNARWHKFFAVSSIGTAGVGDSGPVGPIRPQGIMDPLLWCAESHRQRGGFWRRVGYTVVAILILALYGWLYIGNDRQLSAIERQIAASNPEQTHGLYEQIRETHGWTPYVLTHPYERYRVGADIVTAAENPLKRDLDQRSDAAGKLRTVQDFQAAREQIHQFTDWYPDTEQSHRYSDWLIKQKAALAGMIVAKLTPLAQGGNEDEFNKIWKDEYSVVATPDGDTKVTELKLVLNRSIVLNQLQSMWARTHPAGGADLDDVRAGCKSCEETLSRHPLPESELGIIYLRLVRRVYDDLSNMPEQTVTLWIESSNNADIAWDIKLNDKAKSKTSGWQPMMQTGVANWFKQSCTVTVKLSDLAKPIKTSIWIEEYHYFPKRNRYIGIEDSDSFRELVVNGELTPPGGNSDYKVKCAFADTRDQEAWARLRNVLNDFKKMKGMEDDLFRKPE